MEKPSNIEQLMHLLKQQEIRSKEYILSYMDIGEYDRLQKELSTNPDLYKNPTGSAYQAMIALRSLHCLNSALADKIKINPKGLTGKFDAENVCEFLYWSYVTGYMNGLYGPTLGLEEIKPLVEYGKKFDRRGKPVPLENRRGTSSFTDVMEYLFKQCRDKDKDNLLTAGNIDGFMKFAKQSIQDGKNQDQYVAERIADAIINGAYGYFYMQEGHGRSKPKKGIDPNKYPRSEIQKLLSALRKKNSQSLK